MSTNPRPSPAVPIVIKRRPESPAGGGPFADLHPLLSRLYRARGVCSDSDCDLSLGALHPFESFLDIEPAADLLAGCIRAGGSILVAGDYDADGATGSALAVRGLRLLGASGVAYLVPSRFTSGYGLGPAVVDTAASLGADLIVTVDNGISSLAGVRRAHELDIPVIITDHHLPGGELPRAAAIVNPNRPGDAFPSKSIAGVGVVFYLLAAVRARLRGLDWFRSGHPAPNLAQLLDLVALGTVADVVELDRNNRILVEQGLRRIRAGRCSPGVTALLRVAGCDPGTVTARDLGFAAGPRLNAAGRLTEMSLGVECLLTDDPDRAMAMARELDTLNRRRREIEGEMRDRAEEVLRDLVPDAAGLPPALCLFDADWHQGVIGILAARIRERYQRPVIAFAAAEDGILKGSARSIEGLHIRDLIAAADRCRPGLIERFGGHAMAAGLSLRIGALDAFREAIVAEAHRELGDAPPVRELISDGELPARDLGLDTAECLRSAGPWGKGFPEPLFDGRFEVLERRIVGERHLKLRLRPPGGDGIDAIGFGLGALPVSVGHQVRLAYRLAVNHYRGVSTPQLIVEHLE
ncbi:single-stranded-DNA-specific exonuclease RecJ [Candidatus Thiosymbion oneisti]|uniref:single-stranded-DNA-specific exonuclease RecJ n=1 Tax=Candidatus Thiosymbion oneisti TaxID=589554 RepID=UPI000AAAC271|nr:single-stranded-DNA-specific exonuclease RecJ [Candidatus Thiosymbion oneisti]